MHELSLTRDIVKTVLEYATDNDATSVKTVDLEVGVLRDVVPDLMQKCFAYLAKDTIAQDAQLNFKILPLNVFCLDCGSVFQPDVKAGLIGLRCPFCSGRSLKPVSGMELRVKGIGIGVKGQDAGDASELEA